MLDENWERRFSPDVLARGYRYFEEGYVARVKPTTSGWEATVEGSEDYFVFVGHDFEESGCDCAYFADRGNCKHIAAACYEIEFGPSAARGESSDAAQPDPLELARSLDDSTRLEYLLEIIRNDPDWRDAFVRRFGDLDASRLKRELLEGAAQVVRESSYRGFVDYRNAWRCERVLGAFVRGFLDPIISRRAYGTAFDLTCEFALFLPKIAIDDSDGFFDSMLDMCAGYWKQLAALGDIQLKHAMFAWMRPFLETEEEDCDEADAVWLLQEHAEQFIVDAFAEDPQLSGEVEEFADSIIGSELESWPPQQATAASTSMHFVPSRLITWAKAKIRCMSARCAPFEEVERLVSECPPELEIIQPLVDSAVKSGNTGRAIGLLEQFKARSAGGRFSTDASLQLRKLYDGTGRANDARDELFELCVHGRAQNDEQLRSWVGKLRKRCGGSWPGYEERLVGELSKAGADKYRLHAILAECGRLDELMAALEDFGSRYEFDRYRKNLAARFPNRYLAAYEREVRDALFGQPQQRKVYQRNVRRMQEMLEIPGGIEVVKLLASELRAEYPRRTALMEELDRLPA